MTKKLPLLFGIIFLLYGCTANKALQQDHPIEPLSKEARIEKLSQLKQWQIKGKIAFIQKNKRESASLFWLFDQLNKNQTLKLTTYLGINVLTLNTIDGVHLVETDGESYQSDDLTQLIYSLTGLTLPTEALQLWIKGLRYSTTDKITFDKKSGLPSMLTSYYQGNTWQINYKKYQRVNNVKLAHSLSIKQNDLTIKIMINQWKL